MKLTMGAFLDCRYDFLDEAFEGSVVGLGVNFNL